MLELTKATMREMRERERERERDSCCFSNVFPRFSAPSFLPSLPFRFPPASRRCNAPSNIARTFSTGKLSSTLHTFYLYWRYSNNDDRTNRNYRCSTVSIMLYRGSLFRVKFVFFFFFFFLFLFFIYLFIRALQFQQFFPLNSKFFPSIDPMSLYKIVSCVEYFYFFFYFFFLISILRFVFVHVCHVLKSFPPL